MFIKNKNYDTCIQRVRIEVGALVGLEKNDEAYLTLREIPTIEMMELKEAYEKSEKDLMKFFRNLLPVVIVDHNFYETEQKKMTPKDVSALIFESLELTQKVISDYTNAAFFTRAQKNGDTSIPSALKSSQDGTAPSSTGSTATG